LEYENPLFRGFSFFKIRWNPSFIKSCPGMLKKFIFAAWIAKVHAKIYL